MSKFIPFPFYHDDMPIDLSFVFENEKPAGKHGFLKAKGDQFVFEDGTVGRFWGTNFNGGANFPEFQYSEKVAKRLAKTGVNMVRFHQLDAEWNTPNIFQFAKGKRCSFTTEFDVESMKRLDYLIYSLKQEGIYCYMDMFTYRKFKSGDGVENAILLGDAAKPYSSYNRRMIELQKKLAYDLWTHVNPYTGLAYKDDPVFVMGEVVNESDLFNLGENQRIIIEPYVSEFKELFKDWVLEKNISYDVTNCDINNPDDDTLIQFKIHLQEKYYIEMISFLREIGVKIPFTGTNWCSTPANIKTQTVTDFVDGHMYFYDWRWREFEKNCENKAITQFKNSYLAGTACTRIYEMPFFLSEWDMPWPNEFRGESPLYTAAISALQNWSGCTIHTYSYSANLENMKILGKEFSSSKVGNTPYREGIFSTWNDPAKYGLFYHAALITRRGDVSAADNKTAVVAEDMTKWDEDAYLAYTEVSQIATSFDEKTHDGITRINNEKRDGSETEVISDNGQVYRNWKKNYGVIDTPKTKCAYGFLGKNEAIQMNGLKVDGKTDYSVIAISSLTDDDIKNSDNMLLTAVGHAKNTDSKFEGEQMLDYGKPPVLIEVTRADIEIETSVDTLVVWAVNAEGLYIGTVPTVYENGVLKFTLGEVSQSMYYLIVKE